MDVIVKASNISCPKANIYWITLKISKCQNIKMTSELDLLPHSNKIRIIWPKDWCGLWNAVYQIYLLNRISRYDNDYRRDASIHSYDVDNHPFRIKQVIKWLAGLCMNDQWFSANNQLLCCSGQLLMFRWFLFLAAFSEEAANELDGAEVMVSGRLIPSRASIHSQGDFSPEGCLQT